MGPLYSSRHIQENNTTIKNIKPRTREENITSCFICLGPTYKFVYQFVRKESSTPVVGSSAAGSAQLELDRQPGRECACACLYPRPPTATA